MAAPSCSRRLGARPVHAAVTRGLSRERSPPQFFVQAVELDRASPLTIEVPVDVDADVDPVNVDVPLVSV